MQLLQMTLTEELLLPNYGGKLEFGSGQFFKWYERLQLF
jgi:hypothetical protein